MKAIYGTVARVIDVPSGGLSYLRVEFPVEHHAEATKLFYGKRVLVALSDLQMPFGLVEPQEEFPDAPTDAHDEQEPKRKGPGPLARSAAMVCQDERFHRYVDHVCDEIGCDEERAAVFVRSFCGITSRSELDADPVAQQLFAQLMEAYREHIAESAGMGA